MRQFTVNKSRRNIAKMQGVTLYCLNIRRKGCFQPFNSLWFKNICTTFHVVDKQIYERYGFSGVFTQAPSLIIQRKFQRQKWRHFGSFTWGLWCQALQEARQPRQEAGVLARHRERLSRLMKCLLRNPRQLVNKYPSWPDLLRKVADTQSSRKALPREQRGDHYTPAYFFCLDDN